MLNIIPLICFLYCLIVINPLPHTYNNLTKTNRISSGYCFVLISACLFSKLYVVIPVVLLAWDFYRYRIDKIKLSLVDTQEIEEINEAIQGVMTVSMEVTHGSEKSP